MCGIFGHTGPRISKRSSAALRCVSHRGPDQQNEWHDEHSYLGHQRLSIMDLSENGRQPMEYQGVVITVNGEIYNFQTLKKQLYKKYTFRSESDSEVVLYGYLEWGIDGLVKKLEGMYAFTIYDANTQQVFLVRDRVGIKPLYYAVINDQLAWASELKAIEGFYTSTQLTIDRTALYDFLTYRYIPAPKTMYQNISKLLPAHYLCYDLKTNKHVTTRYWQLQTTPQEISLTSASKRVRTLVDKAVKEQLMSDVPIGFFLSGGMDSSTVVAAAKNHTKLLNTYSIGFDIKEHDETHFAEMVARAFNTHHVRQELSVDEVKASFSKLRTWYDEPFADTSAFPTQKVSALARPSSTVVLTGDGGDEVFGGYNWYTEFITHARDYVKQHGARSLRAKLRSRRAAQSEQVELELEYYTTLMGGLTRTEKATYKKMFGVPDNYDDYWYYKQYYRSELPVLTRLQYLDFHTYLPDDILTKVDRASMSVALECRVPLLATELIEFVFSVPEKIRYHDNQLKGLMKHAYKDVLPRAVIERDKKGFSIPTGRWRGDLMGKKMPMQEYILAELFADVLDAAQTND